MDTFTLDNGENLCYIKQKLKSLISRVLLNLLRQLIDVLTAVPRSPTTIKSSVRRGVNRRKRWTYLGGGWRRPWKWRSLCTCVSAAPWENGRKQDPKLKQHPVIPPNPPLFPLTSSQQCLQGFPAPFLRSGTEMNRSGTSEGHFLLICIETSHSFFLSLKTNQITGLRAYQILLCWMKTRQLINSCRRWRLRSDSLFGKFGKAGNSFKQSSQNIVVIHNGSSCASWSRQCKPSYYPPLCIIFVLMIGRRGKRKNNDSAEVKGQLMNLIQCEETCSDDTCS